MTSEENTHAIPLTVHRLCLGPWQVVWQDGAILFLHFSAKPLMVIRPRSPTLKVWRVKKSYVCDRYLKWTSEGDNRCKNDSSLMFASPRSSILRAWRLKISYVCNCYLIWTSERDNWCCLHRLYQEHDSQWEYCWDIHIYPRKKKFILSKVKQ